MGLREKAVRLESSKAEIHLETEYCKKECIEGKGSVEGGQKKNWLIL